MNCSDSPEKRDSARFLSISILIIFFIIIAMYPIILAIFSIAAQLSLFILNIVAGVLAHKSSEATTSITGARRDRPVFSVHVPTHNEPPRLVIATLASLANQTAAPPYEVIVIDNNTRDPAIWEPVRQWCLSRDRFRFLHREGVEGAKAGALNIALQHTRSDATHIVTVDSDYQVDPSFLNIAAAELLARDLDFIQFPQAYRCCENDGSGIALELADYFDRHATAANHADAMLLTGTLSVISKEALIHVGGWSSNTATEDAELGLRLSEAGYSGAYARTIVGRGLLPLSLRALHSQRFRWASGNMRTLLLWPFGGEALIGNSTRRRQARRLLAATQLTAWVNFAIPAVLTLAIAAVHLAADLSSSAIPAAWLALATLVLALASAALPFAKNREKGPVEARREAVRTAICTRIALLPTSAVATIAGMMPGVQAFKVTPKAVSASVADTDVPLPIVCASLAGVILAGSGVVLSSLPITIGGLLLLVPQLTANVTRNALSGYASSLRLREA